MSCFGSCCSIPKNEISNEFRLVNGTIIPPQGISKPDEKPTEHIELTNTKIVQHKVQSTSPIVDMRTVIIDRTNEKKMYESKNFIVYDYCHEDEYHKCFHVIEYIIDNKLYSGQMQFKQLVKEFKERKIQLPEHFMTENISLIECLKEGPSTIKSTRKVMHYHYS